MLPIKFSSTVSWGTDITNASDLRCLSVIWMERITERFWHSVSCCGEQYRVTASLDNGKYSITLITNDNAPSSNPYRWLDRFLCLLILPPLIFLIAKTCFRRSKRFCLAPDSVITISEPIERAISSMPLPPTLEMFCKLIQKDSFKSSPNYQMEMWVHLINLESSDNKQIPYLRELLRHYPALTKRVWNGWTAMHYAYLKGNQALIQLLESHDKDLIDTPSRSTHKFTFSRGVLGYLPTGGRTTNEHIFPQGITPAELQRQFHNIHARDAIYHFMFKQGSAYQNLSHCPWAEQGLPEDPKTLCNYLHPGYLNQLDAHGFGLLHYTYLFSHGEPIYQTLIEKGADQEVRSRYQSTPVSSGDPIDGGQTAAEFKALLYQRAAWKAIIRRFEKTSEETIWPIPIYTAWGSITFESLETALSYIDVQDTDSNGLTMLYYAVLFDDAPLIEALKKRRAAEDSVPITIPAPENLGANAPCLLEGNFSPAQFKEKFTSAYVTLAIITLLNRSHWSDEEDLLQSPLDGLWSHLQIPTMLRNGNPGNLVDFLIDVNAAVPTPVSDTCKSGRSSLLNRVIHLIITSGHSAHQDAFLCSIATALVKHGANPFEQVESPKKGPTDLYSLFANALDKQMTVPQKAVAAAMHHSLKVELLKSDGVLRTQGALLPELYSIILDYL